MCLDYHQIFIAFAVIQSFDQNLRKPFPRAQDEKSFSELETFGLLPLMITDGSTLNFSFFVQQLCSSLQMKPGFYLTIKTIILKVG